MTANIDRNFMKNVRGSIEAALETLGETLGVKFTVGNGGFADTTGHFKLAIATLGEDGVATSESAEGFKLMAAASWSDFEPDDLGKTYESDGRHWTITGWLPKSHKYPIAVTRDDGKKYKHPEARALAGLARKAKVSLHIGE